MLSLHRFGETRCRVTGCADQATRFPLAHTPLTNRWSPRPPRAVGNLRITLDAPIRSGHGPDPEPLRPGAGQRPPELAGRDRELGQFEVTLERVAAGRPERSMVLRGLRGVGKTVLLNALRGQAVKRAWGTGKIEARPDQSIRIPVAQAVHARSARSATGTATPTGSTAVAGVVKSVRAADLAGGPQAACAGRRRSTYPPPRAAPTAATSSSTSPSCSPTSAAWRRPRRGRRAVRRRDAGHRLRRAGRGVRRVPRDQPAVGALAVVGAGLPHLPVALAASKSYAERLFRYVGSTGSPPPTADRALGCRRGRRASRSRPTR